MAPASVLLMCLFLLTISVKGKELMVSIDEVISEQFNLALLGNKDDFCDGPNPISDPTAPMENITYLQFYGHYFTEFYACSNGIVTFRCSQNSLNSINHLCTVTGGQNKKYVPNAFPVSTIPMIAAFWGDMDYRSICDPIQDSQGLYTRDSVKGCSFFKLYTKEKHPNSKYLKLVDDLINEEYRSALGVNSQNEPNTFKATRVIIQTWYDVGSYNRAAPTYEPVQATVQGFRNPAYYDSNGNKKEPPAIDRGNTFEVVIAFDDKNNSFTVMNYESINWAFGVASQARAAQTGFDAGDSINFQTLVVPSPAEDDDLKKPEYGEFILDLPRRGKANDGVFAFSISHSKVCQAGYYFDSGICKPSNCIAQDTILTSYAESSANSARLEFPPSGTPNSCEGMKSLVHNSNCVLKCKDTYVSKTANLQLGCDSGTFLKPTEVCSVPEIKVSLNVAHTPGNPIPIFEDPGHVRNSYTFSISLVSQTHLPVEISLALNSSLATLSNSTITIEKDKYNVPQYVTVQAIDDSIENDPVVFSVTLSADSNYQASPITYTFRFLNNDQSGIVIVAPGLMETFEKNAENGYRRGERLKEKSECYNEKMPNLAEIPAATLIPKDNRLTGCADNDNWFYVKANYTFQGSEYLTLSATSSNEAIAKVIPSQITINSTNIAETFFFRIIAYSDDLIGDRQYSVSLNFVDSNKFTSEQVEKDIYSALMPFSFIHRDDTINYAGISITHGSKSGKVIPPFQANQNSHFDVLTVYNLSEGYIMPGNLAPYDDVEIQVSLTFQPTSDTQIIFEIPASMKSASISSTEMILSATNWNVPQILTVKGVDDQVSISAGDCYEQPMGCHRDFQLKIKVSETIKDSFFDQKQFTEFFDRDNIYIVEYFRERRKVDGSDPTDLNVNFTMRDNTKYVSEEELAAIQADLDRVAAEKAAESQRQQTTLIGAVVGTLLVLIIIVVIIVVVAMKKVKDLKNIRAKDEEEREKMSKEADAIDIELTLDEEEEGLGNLDDLTSQLRSVNMKLKSEVARLTEVNIQLSESAGIAPLSVVASDDAGTLVAQIRSLKNANDQLRNEEQQTTRVTRKKKKKAQFM